MVVSGPPLPYQSWLHSILVRSFSIKPISGTHQKSKLAPMVLHATVEKLTTWKALLLLSQLHCQKCLFFPKVALSKVQLINVLNDMTLTVLRQAKEELRRAQSRLTRTAISRIVQNQFLHSPAQAQCCLKQLQYLVTRQIHIPPSPWVLNIALLMVYRRISRFRLIRHMCLPPHICTIQVPRHCRLINNRFLPSRSNRLLNTVTQGTHQLLIAVIHRIQDTEPSMGIIRIILTHPHHRMGIPLTSGRRILGIPHSPCQLGIFHRRRQLLLLPSINTEEMVKVLVDKEKGEKPPNVQFVSASTSVCLIKACCFHSSLILCVIWFSQCCFLVIAFAIMLQAFHSPIVSVL